ncbi:hypothetical protein, partial [Staphylococcus epidermidis]|uniref:hypothetical protein n=1 Tax=Staphylococcus epidermidis TaxID=1282 RepID=UPI001C93044F
PKIPQGASLHLKPSFKYVNPPDLHLFLLFPFFLIFSHSIHFPSSQDFSLSFSLKTLLLFL